MTLHQNGFFIYNTQPESPDAEYGEMYECQDGALIMVKRFQIHGHLGNVTEGTQQDTIAVGR